MDEDVSISDDQKKDAEQSYAWLKAYVAAGFTREEAMQILCRPWVTMTATPANYPPEVMEFWERQNALATKLMFEVDDERS